MSQVMVLGHVLDSERHAVLGVAKQRIEKSGVEVDIVANFDVESSWSCGTIDDVLDREILQDGAQSGRLYKIIPRAY